MKIVVVTGSPHKAGTSALLADKFIEGAQSKGHEVFRFNAAFEDIHPCREGAQSKGHEVFRFNAAFEDIHPCRGCDACGMNGPCVQKDAIEEKLIQKLVDCDMIVLVTPLYYFGFSAQLKTVIDRFYSRTGSIHKKKSALLATAWNNDSWTMTALKAHYTRLCQYMEWQDQGQIYATGCGYRSAIEGTEFPVQALELGKKV